MKSKFSKQNRSVRKLKREWNYIETALEKLRCMLKCTLGARISLELLTLQHCSTSVISGLTPNMLHFQDVNILHFLQKRCQKLLKHTNAIMITKVRETTMQIMNWDYIFNIFLIPFENYNHNLNSWFQISRNKNLSLHFFEISVKVRCCTWPLKFWYLIGNLEKKDELKIWRGYA